MICCSGSDFVVCVQLAVTACGSEYCAKNSASDAADNEYVVVEVVAIVYDCGGGMRGAVGGSSGEEITK